MRCISVRQPLASLIVQGHKRLELRSWRTTYTGVLAIHASLNVYKGEVYLPRDYVDRDQVRGAILGTVKLEGCRETAEGDDERAAVAAGDFRYAWVLSEPFMLSSPIPLVGRLSLFKLPIDIETKLRTSIGESPL